MNRRLALSLAALALPALMCAVAAAKPNPSPRSRVSSQASRAGNEIRLSASAGTVAYYSNGKFKAVYRERITTEQVRQTFKFEVEAFTPNAEVPVFVNGMLVANVIVNPLGGGEFQFTSSDNNPGDELPLPGGFPRLRAGDTITIGPLTSTFK